MFDRTDILYRCEMGKRVTFLFMVAYALVMISSGRCAYRSSPRALGEQTGTQGASSSTALLNTARILTKTNCWKISLSNPQGHCQRTANCIYFSFKILKSSIVPLHRGEGRPLQRPFCQLLHWSSRCWSQMPSGVQGSKRGSRDGN